MAEYAKPKYLWKTGRNSLNWSVLSRVIDGASWVLYHSKVYSHTDVDAYEGSSLCKVDCVYKKELLVPQE